MRKIVSAVLFGAALILFAAAVSAGGRSALTTHRVFDMPDSLKLHAWVSRPMSPEPAPLLILLPMRGQDHRSYDDFRQALISRSVAYGENKIPWPIVVAFDLRGHGRSKDKGETSVDFKDMPEEEYMKIPGDVSRAVKELLADSSLQIDSGRIMVIGASIGANSAIMITELIPEISKVVMLSPGEEYLGLEPESALLAFGGEVAIYAAQEDRYSFSSAKIFAQKKEGCTLEEFYGKEHGTDIINTHPEAMKKLLDWLFEKGEVASGAN